MTDEKQIKEMAKIIDDRLIEARNWLGSMNRGEGYWIAQELIKHYQPKLPENAVVVMPDKLNEYQKAELQIIKDQVRKETAREFYQYIIESCLIPNRNRWRLKALLKCKYGVEVKE